MVVYVIDIQGNPLMPTSRNRKVRKIIGIKKNLYRFNSKIS